MKKAVNDLLKIYEETATPRLNITDIKKELTFAKEKTKFSFRLPAILMAVMVLLILIPITFNSLIDHEKPVEPEVLETLYVRDNKRMLSYVKNHFTYYLDNSVKRIRLDDRTVLTLYYAVEDTYDYLIYQIETEEQKAFSISFVDQRDSILLKESSYEIEHFSVRSRQMEIKITYQSGGNTKVFDVLIIA